MAEVTKPFQNAIINLNLFWLQRFVLN